MQIFAPGDQGITFPSQTSPRPVGDGDFSIDPPATASSGLAVSYSSLTPAVCSVSGTTVTPLSAGTCTIAADQPGGTSGGTTYNAAAQVTRDVTLWTPAVVPQPVPVLDVAGLGLLSLLGAGAGARALRRRKRDQ